MTIDFDHLFIGGAFVEPSTANRLEVVSPATEEVIGSSPEAATADVDRAVAAARDAFDNGPWPSTPPAERAAALARMADVYRSRKSEITDLLVTEMGAPIFLADAVLAEPTLLDLYSRMEYEAEEVRVSKDGPALVRRAPVGVVGAIVPWNAPIALTLSKVAPALLAGCTCVVKPAPQTPLDSYVLADAAIAAGLPPGVINIVPGDREVGEHLVRHPDVDKIAFTGSTAAGRRIMSLCGDQVKRVTLELGGKSASIILEDADLATAIPMTVGAGTVNSGQACLALTRVLAPRSRYDEIVDGLAAGMAALPVGDPSDYGTQIGPLVSKAQRERVEGYIEDGKQAGARIVVGGGRPQGLERGWYVEPTLFVDVDNSMRIAREEIFGPVLCVIPYENEEEAVRIANDSNYGLCGAVWTGDLEHGIDLARQVRTGTFNVNGWRYEFEAPFGGFKSSGLGREWGREGLEAYVEYQTVTWSGERAV